MKQAFYLAMVGVLFVAIAHADGPTFNDDIVISNGTPDLVFQDTDPAEADWEICIDGGCLIPGVNEAFNIAWVDGFAKEIPFVIERFAESYQLYVDGFGLVGIGTSVPNADLEIEDVTPRLTLDDVSAGEGRASFAVDMNTASFEGDSLGVDVIQYDVRAPFALDIDEAGKVTFLNDVQLNSSRESKMAIEDVDRAELLTRLGQLPLSRWSYKTQGEDVRHLGPMAEDFHAAFGLGDTPSAISVVDIAGVALAAAQELSREVHGLRKENERLAAELDSLRADPGSGARWSELERRLSRIEGRSSISETASP